MNKTSQKIIIGNSNKMSNIKDKSIDLIITSPPYPMISMWDDVFEKLNKEISKELIENNPYEAFELMHKELDSIYLESFNKLKDDGIVIINIGDATRTCNKKFVMFPNGSRTISFFLKNGFDYLPSIIWNKPTNSPNKFLGSGTLPVGAYNTLEYENILIFRKNKRNFKTNEDKMNRNSSGFFWNERNTWCNCVWSFTGERQKNTNSARERNGAFPLELPYRLISLWSVKGDNVLDIFGGTGTTLLATTALERNGIVVELMQQFKNDIISRLLNSKDILNKKNKDRLDKQISFVKEKELSGKQFKYFNEFLQVPVMTKQEVFLSLPIIKNIDLIENKENEAVIDVTYQ